MRRFWTLLAVVGLLACKKPEPEVTPTTTPPPPLFTPAVLPQASAPSAAPEPSLPPPKLPPLARGAVLTLNVSEGRNPVMSGETNLPDGTELVADLIEGPCEWVFRPDGVYSQDVVVRGGRWTTGPLASNRSPVRDGTFEANVFSWYPSAQPDAVRAIVGQNGEKLRGPLVKNKGDGDVNVDVMRKVIYGNPKEAAALTRQRCAAETARRRADGAE